MPLLCRKFGIYAESYLLSCRKDAVTVLVKLTERVEDDMSAVGDYLVYFVFAVSR